MTATSKNITAFSFATPPATGAIDGLEVAVTVPISTDVTELVATFVTTGASVNIGGVAQVSGVTANDFSADVTYTVVATDASEQDYVVTVTISRVTPLMIAQLRRMVAELTTAIYSDVQVTAYIEKYPHLDEFGEAPLDFYGDSNSDWTPTYDLHGAAADIWEEKAVLKIEKFDFTADGGTFHMSQQYEFCMRQARVNRSRMSPRSARMVQSPAETSKYSDSWIGNLAESD